MIINERISTFINSFDTGNTPFLNEIEHFARENQIPVIRQEVQSLLKFFLGVKQPEEILEVGTAIGFSAILMSEYGPEDARITTIENYDKRIRPALENIKKAGKEKAITLIKGDAADVLKELSGPYELIFMDAAKGQYIHFLPEVLRLMPPGGLLISDNILQDGDVLESRYAVTRRDRTIHSRMREYLYELTHHEQLRTVILPAGDGVTVSVKLL